MQPIEEIVELDLGCKPEAAISGAVLVKTEQSTFLTFNAMKQSSRVHPRGGYYWENAGTAVCEFRLCAITKFGYPNDEAWSGIPRTRGKSYGVFEVLNSTWKAEIDRLNRYSFPNPKSEYPRGRHFLFLFHDSSFECIADDLKLELFREPYDRIFSRIAARVTVE
jgi:hypothetical protein